ncbi:ubiquitin-like protein ATG12 isoform X2 [Zalophus californianus]|uniref:Ubiquitin-like protein ATG12 isoform X2 n=1 Tax=Zalophus californianus TaxID=9704 RepID=A0A6J2DXW3_ZALCA|nr:ubiquitin-like protein ATG12 isoform X2 [Zalophus californianus]
MAVTAALRGDCAERALRRKQEAQVPARREDYREKQEPICPQEERKKSAGRGCESGRWGGEPRPLRAHRAAGGREAGAPGGGRAQVGCGRPTAEGPPAPGSPQGLARAAGKPPSPQTSAGAAGAEPRRRTEARRELMSC